MEITAIEPRRKGLSQLFIDGEEAVKLDSFLLKQQGVKIGQEITDEELHRLIQDSDTRRASEKALYLLEFRSHSKKELSDKIARTAASREAAEAAADRMEELGLVDDTAYAKGLAKTMIVNKQYGLHRVRYELRHKGIDNDIIDEILGEYEDEDFSDTIRTFLDKKYPDYAEDPAVRRRAIAALQRRGYGWDDISRAVEDS